MLELEWWAQEDGKHQIRAVIWEIKTVEPLLRR